MPARLIHTRRESRVSANLLGRAETVDLAEFANDQQCRVNADPMDVGQRVGLRKVRLNLRELFVEDGDLPVVMVQSRQQFVADQAFDRSEVVDSKPCPPSWAERRLVG